MPIFFQQEIDEATRLAVWKIEEEESFFHVPLQREITHPHKRQQHLAGRYLLRYLFPDFPLDLIKIADTRKPYLEDEAFHFSISHCGNYAAAIVSRDKRVGVDIEVPTPKVERIKKKFLHPQELEELEIAEWAMDNRQLSISNGQTTLVQDIAQELDAVHEHSDNSKSQTANPKLTLLWSAKEAVFKWWSYGSVDFSEMIRLQPFVMAHSGSFAGNFYSEERSWDLVLHYRLFDGLCLAWVVQ